MTQEFDLTTCAFVPGGFSVGPDKGRAVWAGRDDAAVVLGRARRCHHIRVGKAPSGASQRGQDPATAPVVHRTDPANLLVSDWVSREGGRDWIHCRMTMTAINKTRITLHCDTAQITLPNPPIPRPA